MKNVILLALFWAFTNVLLAQNWELVKDINEQEVSSNSVYSQNIYSSFPKEGVEFDGFLYLSAYRGDVGRELFRYHHTGTHELVFDLAKGEGDSVNFDPHHLTVVGANLYFVGKDSTRNFKWSVFKFDGTNAPTSIHDFDADYVSFPSSRVRLESYSNKLYFSEDNNTNVTLYEYDGAVKSTIHTKTSSPENRINSFALMNGVLHFYSGGLCSYDGSTFTQVNTDTYNNFEVPYIRSFNNELYLYMQVQNSGVELVKYDANYSSLGMLKDINPGSGDSYLRPQLGPKIEIWNGKMYFFANDGADMSLWESDGTTAGTIKNTYMQGEFHGLMNTMVFNNKLYISKKYRDEGYYKEIELFEFDGTQAPTLISDINPNTYVNNQNGNTYYWGSKPSSFCQYNGQLYFSALAGESGVGRELYTFDGTSVNLAADIAELNKSSAISWMIKFNNQIFFSANDGIHGKELWKTDGTTTEMLSDFVAGADGINPERMFVLNNELYFIGTLPSGNRNYYKTDGTSTPTIVSDLPNQPIVNFKVINDVLYFSNYSSLAGNELFKYDGVNAPTLIADVAPGVSFSSHPRVLGEFNGKVMFTATTPTTSISSGEDLFEYNPVDGTFSVVMDFDATYLDTYEIKEYNGKMYFPAHTDAEGTELWEYDGINPPTMVVNLLGTTTGWGSTFPNGIYPSNLEVMNNKLYFVGSQFIAQNTGNPIQLKNLYSYDGTDTVRVTDFSQSSSYNFLGLKNINNTIYYWFRDVYGNGDELFKYNGINAPEMIPELHTFGSTKANTPYDGTLLELNNNIYLLANDGTTGGYFGKGELYRLNLCTVSDITTSVNNNTITSNNTNATYQWINCADSSVITGETSVSFTPTQNGDYAVILTEGNCSDTSACVTISTIGINELKNANISIFPNPTNGEVRIVSDSKIKNVEVFNLWGQKVLSVSSNNVNIESLQRGMYLFRINTKQGIITKKILKQ